jgi:hypothetical protein
MYFVVMPRVSLIVILMMYVRYLYSINCPTVICLPRMLLFILRRDATSELWTLFQFPLHSFTVYFTHTVYFTCIAIILLPLDTLNPLFTANLWDWQPHRKLGAKYLFVLCAGFTLLLGEDTPTSSYIWRPCPECHEARKHHLLKFGSFSYWFDTTLVS